MRSLNGSAPAAFGEGAKTKSATKPTSLPEGLACYTGTYGVACRLARLGFPVFPCRKGGKEPATPHGFKDATTDTDRLAEWWVVSDDGTTRPLNLGLPTGRPSGLWVLDVDGREGLETLGRLEQEHGPLPETVRVETPSGGVHFYFRPPEGLEVRCATRVLPGVDVRGEGGYVLVPPSVVDGRRYRWVFPGDPPPVVNLGENPELLGELLEAPPSPPVPLADAPGWLLELVVSRGRREPRPREAGAGAVSPPEGQRWPQGERNDRLFREGCALRRRGYSAAEIEAALLVLNAGRCDPPLPEAEVRRVAESAARYEPAGGPGGADLPPDAAPRLAPPPEVPRDALPDPLRDLVDRGAEAGLPAVCLLGAGLAAAAGAIGGGATLEASPSWRERPILWCALIGPPGAGKSPALRTATSPLHTFDSALRADEERWERERVVIGDATLEALARALDSAGGALLVEVDELTEWLRGLGRYKRRGDSDQARVLSLWDGAPWVYERVNGGGRRNNVRFAVERPTVPIVGCLTLEHHRLLGEDSDGMRPRWLPWVSTCAAGARLASRGHAPQQWERAVREFLEARGKERTWELSSAAQRVLDGAVARWQSEKHDATPQLSRALSKAPRHALRIALVLAELENPGAGGCIPGDLAESAVSILEVALAGWRCLPEGRTLALSRRDRTLDGATDALIAFLDERGGEATRRDLLRAHVAGVRTARDLEALLERYREMYPGCVREEPGRGGRARVVIVSPRSPSFFSCVATGDTKKKEGPGLPENPHEKAENAPPGVVSPTTTGDTTGDRTAGREERGETSPSTTPSPRGVSRARLRACASHVDPEAPDNGFRPGCRYCAAATERASSRDDTRGGGGL